MNSISPQMAAAGEEGMTRSAALSSVWLGYAPTGGRVSLRLDEVKRRILLGGSRSAELSALFAFACRESDLRILVLDTDGTVSGRASGYMEHYDYTCFLYDAFRIDEYDSTRHGQLISAAYTAALGLDSEEEAIVNAAMHHLSLNDSIATPSVLFNNMDAVEGFRGFYVDKLKGRIGGLKFFDSAENGSLRSLLSLGSSIISFGSSRYPQATELASAAFLAKLLALLPNASLAPDVIMVTGAHRIFGGLPNVKHRERLLSELLGSPATFALACDQAHALSDSVWDAFPYKVLSSDAWNDKVENRWKEHTHNPILPNAYTIADGHYGHQRTFIARTFEQKFAEPRSGPDAMDNRPQRDDELTVLILQDVKGFEAPTRTSISEFLSGKYGIKAVEVELDRLFSEGCIKLESRESRPGGHGMLVYRITPKGLQTLEGLSR